MSRGRESFGDARHVNTTYAIVAIKKSKRVELSRRNKVRTWLIIDSCPPGEIQNPESADQHQNQYQYQFQFQFSTKLSKKKNINKSYMILFFWGGGKKNTQTFSNHK